MMYKLLAVLLSCLMAVAPSSGECTAFVRAAPCSCSEPSGSGAMPVCMCIQQHHHWHQAKSPSTGMPLHWSGFPSACSSAAVPPHVVLQLFFVCLPIQLLMAEKTSPLVKPYSTHAAPRRRQLLPPWLPLQSVHGHPPHAPTPPSCRRCIRLLPPCTFTPSQPTPTPPAPSPLYPTPTPSSLLLPTKGQGLKVSGSPVPMGASGVWSTLQYLYDQSEAWKAAFKANPASACSQAGGTLCSAGASKDATLYGQLVSHDDGDSSGLGTRQALGGEGCWRGELATSAGWGGGGQCST